LTPRYASAILGDNALTDADGEEECGQRHTNGSIQIGLTLEKFQSFKYRR